MVLNSRAFPGLWPQSRPSAVCTCRVEVEGGLGSRGSPAAHAVGIPQLLPFVLHGSERQRPACYPGPRRLLEGGAPALAGHLGASGADCSWRNRLEGLGASGPSWSDGRQVRRQTVPPLSVCTARRDGPGGTWGRRGRCPSVSRAPLGSWAGTSKAVW